MWIACTDNCFDKYIAIACLLRRLLHANMDVGENTIIPDSKYIIGCAYEIGTKGIICILMHLLEIVRCEIYLVIPIFLNKRYKS